MRRWRPTVRIAAVLIAGCATAAGQPMSGTFTVGGSSPSFPTLQAAANALKARGLGGPVTFNIRPGTYSEGGGTSPVLILDGPVAGQGPANRITLQADPASGGNETNTFLAADQTAQTSLTLAQVKLDYVTIRKLSFVDADSGAFGARELLRVTLQSGVNQTVEGFVLEDCIFSGNPAGTDAGNRGTRNGFVSDVSVTDPVIRRNTFRRFLEGIVAGGGANAAVTTLIEDNLVQAGHAGRLGFGVGINAGGRVATVRRNIVDNAGSNGGESGITVIVRDTAIVERNYLRNGGGVGSTIDNFDYAGIVVRGPTNGHVRFALVANNMISNARSSGGAREGISINTRHATVAYNTVVHPPRQQVSRGIVAGQDSCRFLNNIILDFSVKVPALVAPIIAFAQPDAPTNLVSDYNVIFCSDTNGFVVTRGSTRFRSLLDYSAATRLDSNSRQRSVDFLDREQNVHLTDCQGQDPALRGIPVAGVTVDYDGETRSATAPMRGADETRARGLDMFAAPFKIALPGTPFSVAAGRFDNIIADGLAVPDYDNRQVRLYHNNSSSRSFTLSSVRSTGFRPTVVRFYDLDRDGNLDLVVGGETTAVRVFWGDGAGGFPQETLVPTSGPVRSLDTGRTTFSGIRTVIMTESVGSLAQPRSIVAYLNNQNGRNLQHNFVITPRPGGGTMVDTVDGTLLDFAVGDLDGNGTQELAVLGLDSGPPPLHLYVDTTFGNLSWGHRDLIRVNTASYGGHASAVAIGRFDADADNDLVATGASIQQLVFLRNQGNRTFVPETVPVNSAVALAALDYERDGDLDVVTVNRQLDDNGLTVMLNDGTGRFEPRFNCFLPFASGVPFGAVAADFDLDGRTDLAIASSFDTVFVLYNLGGGTSGVEDGAAGERPAAFALEQNYPNPFNPSTRIRFNLPSSGPAVLTVYDLLGREVRTLVRGNLEPGRHEVTFDARGLASGIYFYRLEAGGNVMTRKLTLMR